MTAYQAALFIQICIVESLETAVKCDLQFKTNMQHNMILSVFRISF